MTRRALFLVAITSNILGAQQVERPRQDGQYEFGIDVASRLSPANEIQRAHSSPVTLRFGAIGHRHGVTLDQQFVLGERRLRGNRGPRLMVGTQVGYRFSSPEKRVSSPAGPYAFAGYTFAVSRQFFDVREDAPSRPMFGGTVGVGTRVMLLQTAIRLEAFAGHDLGTGERGDRYWIPARNSVGVRVGSSYFWRPGP